MFFLLSQYWLGPGSYKSTRCASAVFRKIWFSVDFDEARLLEKKWHKKRKTTTQKKGSCQVFLRKRLREVCTFELPHEPLNASNSSFIKSAGEPKFEELLGKKLEKQSRKPHPCSGILGRGERNTTSNSLCLYEENIRHGEKRGYQELLWRHAQR